VHGSKDRAKDASPGACDDLSCLRRVHTLCGACRRTFPSSATFWTSAVIGALACSGGYRHQRERTDRGPRSDNAPRRALPSRRPGCLSPSRHAKDSWFARRDCSLRPSRRLSRSRRPHVSPGGGRALDGHCECHGAVTRLVRDRFRECKRLFDSLELPRLGLTTQARHRARLTRPSTRTDCLARTDVSRSA
jgi:hypothetical protein